MLNRDLTVMISDETFRLIEASIASGEFFDASDVIQTAIERLCASEEDFDDWIRREALPALDKLEANPSSGLTLQQVFTDIDEHETGQLPIAR